MADLQVTWDQYNATVERLAGLIHESGWQFNQIVCIARGGLRIGDAFSRIFDLPLAIVFTQSYVGDKGQIRGDITISRHMAMMTEKLGDRVLVVDDLVDSGVTLDAVMHRLRADNPEILDIRTAVLWWKAVSAFKPDYYVTYLPDNPWIHQPFERYDLMKADDLKKV